MKLMLKNTTMFYSAIKRKQIISFYCFESSNVWNKNICIFNMFHFTSNEKSIVILILDVKNIIVTL